ncbi:MAG TPA: aspartyl beta-hydroxylase [Caulobacteraceae bacterium]|nr:aspartyl beta-hydroxylase [Caulobacteraceae bacterium]
MSAPQPSAIERFRAAVFADEGLQAELGAAEDWPAFIEAAAAAARRLGLEPGSLDLRPRADPLGLLRFEPPAGAPPLTPQKGWRPAQVAWDGGALAVDWAYFGARRLAAPFYEGDLRAALARPFNILFRFRTPLSELGRWTAALPGLRPSGLIFHMSRCGSTLVSQMLAASPANLVVSEARPIDIVLQIGEAAQANVLAAMIGALGRAASGERRCFIKLEAWHVLALPAFRAAFPDTPWLFLYRDPAEVIVSHLGQPAPLAPPAVLAAICGEAAAEGPGAEQTARLLGAFCRGALEAHAGGGGLLVNYDELPDALWSRILPHFDIEPSEEERAPMAAAAGFDAKAPWLEFATDAEDKRRRVDDAVREACRLHLDEAYDRLEALRQRP